MPQGLAAATRELLEEALDASRTPHAELTPNQIGPAPEDIISAAVDAGSSVLLDLSSCGLVAVRAGATQRLPVDRFRDSPPLEQIRLIRRATLAKTWEEVVRDHAWGNDIEAPVLRSGQGLRGWADTERSVTEFDASMRALRDLPAGGILLLDGALDDDGWAPALRQGLLRRAESQGVHVAALSKDSSLTFSGTLPFTLELEAEARAKSWPARFFVDVTRALKQPGRSVRTFGARFDERGTVYRVDAALVRGNDPTWLFAQLARLCNDAAYPGYPYALARIHNQVHYEDGETADLRRDLEARVAERRGSLLGSRLFSKGRDVLVLGG